MYVAASLVTHTERLTVMHVLRVNKYYDLIDQEQVSISYKFPYKLKDCYLRLGLLLGSNSYVKLMGIVARI